MCEVLLAAFYLAAFLLFCAAVFFFAELWFSPSRWECIACVFGIASAGGKKRAWIFFASGRCYGHVLFRCTLDVFCWRAKKIGSDSCGVFFSLFVGYVFVPRAQAWRIWVMVCARRCGRRLRTLGACMGCVRDGMLRFARRLADYKVYGLD